MTFINKYVPIAILLVFIVSLLTCNSSTTSVINSVKTVITNDTTVIYTVKTDTVIRYDSIISLRDTIICDTLTISKYIHNIDDSLITGTIVIESALKPILTYELTTKSFHTDKTITKTITNLKGFMYGGGLTVEPLLSQLEINAAYQFKRGNILSLGLGYDFQNQNQLIKVNFLKKF